MTSRDRRPPSLAGPRNGSRAQTRSGAGLAGRSLGLLGLLCASLMPAAARSDSSEEAAIRQAALDYAESWYEGKPERMEKVLHPDFAQHLVTADPKSGKSRLEQMSALGLIQGVRAGFGKHVPKDEQQKEVTVLDHAGNMASVKLVMQGWIDYLQLAKWNGEWRIVNALWEAKPGPK